MRNSTAIPASRRVELLSTLAQHFDCGVYEVTDDLIRTASDIDPR